MASERGHDLAAGCGHARTGRDDRLADDPGAGVSDARERREAVYGAFPGAGPASGRGLTGHRMPFRGSFRPWGSPNSPGSTSVPRHRRPGPAASTPTYARKRTLPPAGVRTLPLAGADVALAGVREAESGHGSPAAPRCVRALRRNVLDRRGDRERRLQGAVG